MQSLEQVRVVDPVVTTLARGYRNAAFIFTALFPFATVGARAGKILEFNADDFVKRDLHRAPGSTRQRITIGHEGEDYACLQSALDGAVPLEHQQEAAAVLGIDLNNRASNTVMQNTHLQIEIAAGALAADSTKYPATHVLTLSGNSQWDNDNANPAAAVEAAKEVVAGAIAVKPNTLVLGSKVYSKLKNAKAVIDRVKYTQAPGVDGGAKVNADTLKAYFDVENLAVGEARHGKPGAFTSIWDNIAVLAYTNTSTVADAVADRGEPSFGYTYRLQGYPFAEMAWFDKTVDSWIHPFTSEDTPVIAGKEAGFLFKSVVS